MSCIFNSAFVSNLFKIISKHYSHTRSKPFAQNMPTMSQTCGTFRATSLFHNTPLAKRQRTIHVHCTSSSSYQPTTLDNSRRLAYFRAQETLLQSPLLTDTYAAPLAESFTTPYPPSDPTELSNAAFDMISARFIDDQCLQALGNINVGRDQPYNQLVLVGDGYCTRPFRLNLPTGTVIYLVAPGEVHERAEALLAERPTKARVPRGCLLKRIDCNFIEGNSCATELQRAGYRADRVSVWALQVNLLERKKKKLLKK
jgi:Leucine carboxyl methyltransferase